MKLSQAERNDVYGLQVPGEGEPSELAPTRAVRFLKISGVCRTGPPRRHAPVHRGPRSACSTAASSGRAGGPMDDRRGAPGCRWRQCYPTWIG